MIRLLLVCFWVQCYVLITGRLQAKVSFPAGGCLPRVEKAGARSRRSQAVPPHRGQDQMGAAKSLGDRAEHHLGGPKPHGEAKQWTVIRACSQTTFELELVPLLRLDLGVACSLGVSCV